LKLLNYKYFNPCLCMGFYVRNNEQLSSLYNLFEEFEKDGSLLTDNFFCQEVNQLEEKVMEETSKILSKNFADEDLDAMVMNDEPDCGSFRVV
jgi:hypothetical protein